MSINNKIKSPNYKPYYNFKILEKFNSFIRIPLAWVLIFLLLMVASAESYYRENHREACAAASMLLDRQIFRGVVDCCGRAETRFLENCIGYSTPYTYDLRKIKPLGKVSNEFGIIPPNMNDMFLPTTRNDVILPPTEN